MTQEPWFSVILLVARVFMSIVFLVSGIEKGLNFSRALEEYKKDSIPVPQLSVVFTIALHLVASICLIAGWLVTEMAFALALFTLIATVMVHHFWTMTGVERLQRSRVALANLGLAGGLLLLAVTGPGALVV